MRFLLVDDEKSALMSLKYQLARHRIEATTFDEEAAALSAFEKDPGSFDAVVAKLAMRRIRGDTFAQQVWAIEPEMPITILCGLPDQDRTDHARIETGVWMLGNPAPVSEILLSLESQGLRLPAQWREVSSAKPDKPADSGKPRAVPAP